MAKQALPAGLERAARGWRSVLLGAGMALATLSAPCTLLGADAAGEPPSRHPADEAVAFFAAPVAERLSVRNADGLYDAWIFSTASLDTLAERARLFISSRRELLAGLRLTEWSWTEAERSYLLFLEGPPRQRLRLLRHLSGALLIVPDVGLRSEAARWAPTYTPPPVLLRHGPVR